MKATMVSSAGQTSGGNGAQHSIFVDLLLFGPAALARKGGI